MTPEQQAEQAAWFAVWDAFGNCEDDDCDGSPEHAALDAYRAAVAAAATAPLRARIEALEGLPALADSVRGAFLLNDEMGVYGCVACMSSFEPTWGEKTALWDGKRAPVRWQHADGCALAQPPAAPEPVSAPKETRDGR